MGLSNQSQLDYYTNNNYGSYQFVTLKNIIDQFVVAYVGENKLISKVSKTDVAFHAQRAVQELSFDTFKSVKSQEIVLPSSLTMILPHDYVNYTQLSWSDEAGIKHPLYPTNQTSNPFKIKQDDNGNYDFGGNAGVVPGFINSDFSTNLNSLQDWSATNARINTKLIGGNPNPFNPNAATTVDIFGVVSEKLTGTFHRELSNQTNSLNTPFSRTYSCWQEIDVSGLDELDLEATGFAPKAADGFVNATIRLGISRTQGDHITNPLKNNGPSTNNGTVGTNSVLGGLTTAVGPNFIPYANSPGTFNKAYIQWRGSANADDSATKQLPNIDVSNFNKVYVLVTMFVETPPNVDKTATLTLDDIKLTFEGSFSNLQSDGTSTTSSNFSSMTPRENIDKYDDGTYDLVLGERYGIEPVNSQVNGSYFIDNLRGLINFSSNVEGKTVILDYISDSLGTDEEMQVHKFAQEAMYKHIMYAILSTRANVPEYVVRRYKKEKFAATRQAKLRLSNIKTEEIIQTLRGKSKWIKH